MGAPEVLPRPYRAALIGGGFIGPVHAEALRRIGVEVIGLLDATPELARAAAAKVGVSKVYNTLDELLADSAVDTVHIASPNFAHYEQAKRVLEAGKHVVCEKPLANTSKETAALRDLARSRPGQAAAVNYNIRFYPLCHEMRDRVARGDIGRVLSVTGSYTQDWLLLPEDYNWRVEPDGATNLRAIADIGTHWMDLAQYITGQKIKSVMADLATFHKERFKPIGKAETFGGAGGRANTQAVPITTDDHGAVLFHMGDATHGLYHVSQGTAGRKNRLFIEVAGTEGSLVWDSQKSDELWIGRRTRLTESVQRDPAQLAPSAAAISHYPGGHAEGFPDAFKQLALSVYKWIDGGAQGPAPFPTFEEGHYEVLLCEAIARSARDRAWVDVQAL
ncbi:MAG: Gfo/Idh/MocA family oxidoreductase [Isosphaeraceae bacterium]